MSVRLISTMMIILAGSMTVTQSQDIEGLYKLIASPQLPFFIAPICAVLVGIRACMRYYPQLCGSQRHQEQNEQTNVIQVDNNSNEPGPQATAVTV